MDSSINFKGAFLIKQPTPTVRRAIKPLLGNNSQVVENVGKQGGVLYVMEDKHDKDVADFIMQMRKVKFKYYPNLGVKNKIDPNNPKQALMVMKKCSQKVLNTIQELRMYFSTAKRQSIKPKKMSVKDSLMSALKYNQAECSIKTHRDGISIMDAGTKKMLGESSPPDAYGITYVRLKPGVKDYRFAAVRNGDIIFKYPQESENIFNESYNSAVEFSRQSHK